MNISRVPRSLAASVVLLGLFAAAGCSSASKAVAENADEQEDPVSELRTQLGSLNARIAELESKLSAVNGKLESVQAASHANAATDRTERTAAAPVIAHPADRAGTPLSPARVATDPDAGFVNDEAVQNYRKALVQLQSKQYSDAVLAFSDFLEHHPDHPLAGSAQFYVGEAYFAQKEYKLALQEFRRVLTSYDRTPHVPEALRKMALAEDLLNMKDEAKTHRQLLSSLYPQSPAAASSPASETEATETGPNASLDGPPLTAPVEQNRDNAKH